MTFLRENFLLFVIKELVIRLYLTSLDIYFYEKEYMIIFINPV